MTNRARFELFAKYDFERVEEYLRKGYTETEEFKERLEMLASSLEALLQDIDNSEVA